MTPRPARVGAARRTVRIGLTGPIGCGKSTIAAWLEEAGGIAIDADRIAREVTGPSAATLGPIRDRFGDLVFLVDGTLDRAALAELVFGDAAALADLEDIVHPAVRERLVDEVTRAEASGAPFVVVEAIKLVEAGYAAECDEIWLVVCDPAAQRARLLARGADESDVERRVGAQGQDLVERLTPAATRIVSTDGSPDEARARAIAALRAAVGSAGKVRPREP